MNDKFVALKMDFYEYSHSYCKSYEDDNGCCDPMSKSSTCSESTCPLITKPLTVERVLAAMEMKFGKLWDLDITYNTAFSHYVTTFKNADDLLAWVEQVEKGQ